MTKENRRLGHAILFGCTHLILLPVFNNSLFQGVTFVTVNVNSRSITTKKFLSTINFSNDVSTEVTTVAPRFTQIQYAVAIPENVPARNLTWVGSSS